MPIKDGFAREDIADLAYSYNMPGVVVDGMDAVAVYEAAGEAIDRARSGKGPTLLECKTYDGKTIRLCDFASAGEVGTPYLSWLSIKNAPKAGEFSTTNPLRSSRPTKQKRR